MPSLFFGVTASATATATMVIIILRFKARSKLDFALTRQVHYHAGIVVWFRDDIAYRGVAGGVIGGLPRLNI